MKYIKSLKLGSKEPKIIEDKKFGLIDFIDDFLKNIQNPLLLDVYYRMLDIDNYAKVGSKVYIFTESDKQKIKELKPYFKEIFLISKNIKDIKQK